MTRDKHETYFGALFYSLRAYPELFMKNNLELLNVVGGKRNIEKRKFDVVVNCPNVEAYHKLMRTMEPIDCKLNQDMVKKSLTVEMLTYQYNLFVPYQVRNQLRKEQVKIVPAIEGDIAKTILVFPKLETLLSYMDTTKVS
jgi:hypothetical protein